MPKAWKITTEYEDFYFGCVEGKGYLLCMLVLDASKIKKTSPPFPAPRGPAARAARPPSHRGSCATCPAARAGPRSEDLLLEVFRPISLALASGGNVTHTYRIGLSVIVSFGWDGSRFSRESRACFVPKLDFSRWDGSYR